MASEASDRDLLADFTSRKKPSRRSRAQDEADRSGGEQAARRLGYQLGREGRTVSEYILQRLIGRRDLATLQEIEHIRARLKTLDENDFTVLTHVRHSLGMFLGLAIVVGAMLVDYRIIHEFWTRIAMDDLGRVAASLKLSVYFKSAQVVFATLAFHFMLETLGEKGRKVFIRTVFALTTVMLVGIGIIVALKWLPAGSSLFGLHLNKTAHSGGDILSALGLSVPEQKSGSDVVNNIETGLWLVSLSMIFIIVTSVGALSLQQAVHQFQVLSGAKVDDPDHTDSRLQLTGNRSQRQAQLRSRARHYGIDPDKPESGDGIDERKRAISRCLVEFAGSYAVGLHAFESAFFGFLAGMRKSRAETLLTTLNDAMKGMPGFVEDYLARHHEAFEAASPADNNIVSLAEKKKGGSGGR